MQLVFKPYEIFSSSNNDCKITKKFDMGIKWTVLFNVQVEEPMLKAIHGK